MRLIDADKIPWTDLNDNPNSNIKVLVTFAEKVNRMPTIEERKTGKWEQDNPFTKPRCSECGEPCFGLHGFDYTLTLYCPNCGTRMER